MNKSFLLLALAAVVAGCGSSAPAQTDQQVKDFKGGPMPADVAARIDAARSAGNAAGEKAASEQAGKGP